MAEGARRTLRLSVGRSRRNVHARSSLYAKLSIICHFRPVRSHVPVADDTAVLYPTHVSIFPIFTSASDHARPRRSATRVSVRWAGDRRVDFPVASFSEWRQTERGYVTHKEAVVQQHMWEGPLHGEMTGGGLCRNPDQTWFLVPRSSPPPFSPITFQLILEHRSEA